jgi:hypothetical protein
MPDGGWTRNTIFFGKSFFFSFPPAGAPHNVAANFMTKVPLSELTDRMKRFRARMDAENPNWELAAFFGRVNQYYFTGTMQDGVLLVPRDGEAVFWVRRSFERAGDESLFPDIRPMKSFRDATPSVPAATARQVIHIETELVPLALVQRFRKHFLCKEVASLDAQIARVRAVKSSYELAIMERCGAMHRRRGANGLRGELDLSDQLRRTGRVRGPLPRGAGAGQPQPEAPEGRSRVSGCRLCRGRLSH